MSLIVLSIPLFFLFIGLELMVSRIKKLSYYRFNDAVTNLSCGIGSQITGIFLKALTVVAYIKLYDISPLKGLIPNVWWVWIVLFIGVDFFYYWFHRLAHEISVMWGSHAVHHQSEEYNLTVALRQAWFQGAFSFVFYLPLALLGFRPELFLVIASLQTLYQFWIHTKMIGKLPAPIEYIFNTPSHHRVHHGVNPKYIDRNHGGTLIIFDRMFGTFQQEEEEVVYGITKQPKSWNPLWVNFEYWEDTWKTFLAAPDWKDKISVWLKQPGWRPASLGGISPPKEVSPQTFQKYNTEVSNRFNHYIFFEFVLLLLGTSAFLVLYKKDPLNHLGWQITFSAIIILTVVNFGAMFEKKKWVVPLEYFRHLLIPILVYLLLQNQSYYLYAISIFAALSIIGAIWFSRFVPEINQATPSRLTPISS